MFVNKISSPHNACPAPRARCGAARRGHNQIEKKRKKKKKKEKKEKKEEKKEKKINSPPEKKPAAQN